MASDAKPTKKTAIERFREEAAKQGVVVEEVHGTPGSGEIFVQGPRPGGFAKVDAGGRLQSGSSE